MVRTIGKIGTSLTHFKKMFNEPCKFLSLMLVDSLSGDGTFTIIRESTVKTTRIILASAHNHDTFWSDRIS